MKDTYVFYENSGNVVAAATKRFLKKHAGHSFTRSLGELVPLDSRSPEFAKQM